MKSILDRRKTGNQFYIAPKVKDIGKMRDGHSPAITHNEQRKNFKDLSMKHTPMKLKAPNDERQGSFLDIINPGQTFD